MNKNQRHTFIEIREVEREIISPCSQKGYICFDPLTNKIHVSKDVIFVEDEFYFVDSEGAKALEEKESAPIVASTPQEPIISPPPNGVPPSPIEEENESHEEENGVNTTGPHVLIFEFQAKIILV